MPPDPQVPDQNETSKPATPPPGQVDIDKILLPKKEAPGATTQSAQRVSAGVLLDQEQKAGQEGLPKAAPKAAAQPTKAQTPSEESEVRPLETYQADIEKVMQGGGTSVISIAAAEAQRRARMSPQAPESPAVPLRERITAFFKKFSMIVVGAALLIVAIGVLAYLFLRPTTVPVATPLAAPFISVDDTQVVSVAPGEPGRNLMTKLNAAKHNVALSLGLIARLVPSLSSTTASGAAVAPMDAQTFMALLAPHLPDDLLRTFEPTYLMGVHVYDQNQPFLIVTVDSYEQAYSGMLAWETFMQGDLAPLFTYTPSPRVNTAPAIILDTASTTATSTPPAGPVFVPAPRFIDKIVENHDARVLQNDAGDVYLLWTFLDRNTVVITTNPATLREIIARFQEAPVTAIPRQ